MRPGVMDGKRWIAQRLKFLRDRLAEDPPDAERQAIEAEIAALSKERGILPGGRRFPRLLRNLRRRSR